MGEHHPATEPLYTKQWLRLLLQPRENLQLCNFYLDKFISLMSLFFFVVVVCLFFDFLNIFDSTFDKAAFRGRNNLTSKHVTDMKACPSLGFAEEAWDTAREDRRRRQGTSRRPERRTQRGRGCRCQRICSFMKTKRGIWVHAPLQENHW